MKSSVLFVLLIGLFLVLPLVEAESIAFLVDQEEYYFLTGQQAVIPLTINNTYDQDIDGTMSYTIVQTINQGGMQYSSSKSNAQSFSVQKNNQTIGMNFGSSNTPVTLTVSMEFSFDYDSEDYLVSLDDIIIHFVTNESQMNNQQNPTQSTSEKIINAQQQQPSSQQQQQPQTTQEKLQNNQLNQDSQALKEQMQQQMEEQQQMEQAFQDTVENHPTIKDLEQQLQKQGYQRTDESYQSETNDTGSFNFSYEKENGQQATVSGEMEDGEITSLEKMTAEDREQMLDTLNQSETFQEFRDELLNQGFNQTNISFSQTGNMTSVELTYENDENETAVIHAEFSDEKLQEVWLEKHEEYPWYLFLLLAFIPLSILLIYLYMRYRSKIKDSGGMESSLVARPFDYRAEAQRLLADAKKDFDLGRFKDAYGKAGQSIRLFLSYHHGLEKEMTNDDLIRYLKKMNHAHQHIKQCLDLCSLVEFAKYSANEPDFSKITDITKKVIT